jgi:multidrug efflux pump subunit AcrA (membrane-fusion protein)
MDSEFFKGKTLWIIIGGAFLLVLLASRSKGSGESDRASQAPIVIPAPDNSAALQRDAINANYASERLGAGIAGFNTLTGYQATLGQQANDFAGIQAEQNVAYRQAASADYGASLEAQTRALESANDLAAVQAAISGQVSIASIGAGAQVETARIGKDIAFRGFDTEDKKTESGERVAFGSFDLEKYLSDNAKALGLDTNQKAFDLGIDTNQKSFDLGLDTNKKAFKLGKRGYASSDYQAEIGSKTAIELGRIKADSEKTSGWQQFLGGLTGGVLDLFGGIF